jgi:Zn finger protein HypA/HybF involved in hydrogenase expression
VAAGPPPIRTKDGWLFIYHAIDEKDQCRYKMGAMLLDIKYPPKVLARTTHPILEPVAWYENEGLKAGVAYPCGAVILKDQLFVYYGGADMVVCVATAKMNEFMSQLSYEHEPMRTSVPMTPAQVSVPVNPVVNVPVKVQEHIYGYCVKCRAKAEIKNSHHVIIKNRRHAIQGICPRCGSKMFRFRNS